MNSKDLAIGILSTTAAILLVGLVIVYSQPEPAYASTVGVQAGDYVLGVGRFDERAELLYVVDVAVNGMNVYVFDFKTGALGITDQVNLGLLRAKAQGATPTPPPAGRSGRRTY